MLNDDAFLTKVGSISALFNAARFIWSGALDKFCFKKVYGVLLLIQIACAFSIKVTEESRFGFATLVCLTLFCIGGHFALFPNVLKQIFGKQATFLYGIMFTGTGLASLTIVGLVFSPLGSLYQVMFYIFGCFSLLSMGILVFFFEQNRYEPDWPSILEQETGGDSEGSLEEGIKDDPFSQLLLDRDMIQ